ncbi:unnamed protein product, partial [Protopolystoma xenopodis]
MASSSSPNGPWFTSPSSVQKVSLRPQSAPLSGTHSDRESSPSMVAVPLPHVRLPPPLYTSCRRLPASDSILSSGNSSPARLVTVTGGGECEVRAGKRPVAMTTSTQRFEDMQPQKRQAQRAGPSIHSSTLLK